MDTLRVEVERKMSFSHSHHKLRRFFTVTIAVTTILIFEPDRVRKDILVVPCLDLSIFLVSFQRFGFETLFSSLGTRLTTHLAAP